MDGTTGVEATGAGGQDLAKEGDNAEPLDAEATEAANEVDAEVVASESFEAPVLGPVAGTVVEVDFMADGISACVVAAVSATTVTITGLPGITPKWSERVPVEDWSNRFVRNVGEGGSGEVSSSSSASSSSSGAAASTSASSAPSSVSSSGPIPGQTSGSAVSVVSESGSDGEEVESDHGETGEAGEADEGLESEMGSEEGNTADDGGDGDTREDDDEEEEVDEGEVDAAASAVSDASDGLDAAPPPPPPPSPRCSICSSSSSGKGVDGDENDDGEYSEYGDGEDEGEVSGDHSVLQECGECGFVAHSGCYGAMGDGVDDSGGPRCRRCSGQSKEVRLSAEVEAANAFDNSACFVCGSGEDEHLVLMCDGCPNEYHIGCLSPPLAALPEEDTWLCPKCCSTEEAEEAHTSSSSSSSSSSNVVRLRFPAQAFIHEGCLVCGQVKRREERNTESKTRDRETERSANSTSYGVVRSMHVQCVYKLVQRECIV